MKIHRSVFYRAQHVTGPACVLVSLAFGKMPTGGPRIVRLLSERTTDPLPKFDVKNHITEILAGVERANGELNGSLEVEAVELVPDDYPKQLQAEHVAYKIACAVLSNEI
jgi:hypothetical protein